MCEVPVFYATTEGHTRRVAERIAEQIRKHGLDSRPVAIISEDASHIDWARVRGVAVGASLHMQKHQGEAVAFAGVHRQTMSLIPSLFFSVSLSAASKNAASVKAAEQLAANFAERTGWRPTRIASVGGCLAYSRYNWFMRRVMRRIALKEGGSPDMSRDHDYTNWDVVEQLADDLAYDVRRREVFPDGGQILMHMAPGAALTMGDTARPTDALAANASVHPPGLVAGGR